MGVERCVTCMYYDRKKTGADAKSGNAGQCRRSGPSLSPLNQKTYMIEGVWPTVRDDDWCGEWKALQRRVDTSRLGEVFGTPLSSPLPASPLQSRVTPQAARAALGLFSGEARATPPAPLAPMQLPDLGSNGRGND